MVSLEGMQERFKLPKHYYVFYNIFYRAAVGDMKWREYAKQETGRIGNNNTEAFALLLLTNKYKAWLFEAKKQHGDSLKTEYEMTPTDRAQSIADFINPNTEFDIEELQMGTSIENSEEGNEAIDDEEDDNGVETERQVRHREAPDVLLRTPNTTVYKNAVKLKKKWYAELKKLDSCQEMMDGVRNAETALTDLSENINIPEEQATKKRKLLKTLSPFTGSKTADGDNPKYKGWSDEGHNLYQHHCRMLQTEKESGAIAVWEKAYRKIFMEMEGKKKTKIDRERVEVDLDLVWEL